MTTLQIIFLIYLALNAFITYKSTTFMENNPQTPYGKAWAKNSPAIKTAVWGTCLLVMIPGILFIYAVKLLWRRK